MSMIQLKGTHFGLLRCIVPEDISEKKMLEQFNDIVSSGKNLLKGSKVIMDMKGREFTPALVGKIWKGFIEPTEASVVSWVLSDSNSEDCLNRLGVRTGEPTISSEKEHPDVPKLKDSTAKGLLYVGAIRGGQTLTHKGDIIVLGNVHTNAEVYADGHIVVLGRVMGLVHAGFGGDTGMSVAVRSYESGQIRIAGKAAIVVNKEAMFEKSLIVTCDGDNLIFSDWPDV